MTAKHKWSLDAPNAIHATTRTQYFATLQLHQQPPYSLDIQVQNTMINAHGREHPGNKEQCVMNMSMALNNVYIIV